VAEAARGVHGDENQGRLAVLGICDAFIDIGSQDGFDDAMQIQVEDDGRGNVFVRGDGGEKAKEREGGESDENKMLFQTLKPIGREWFLPEVTFRPPREWCEAGEESANQDHGAPPWGFEFWRCSSNCLASV